jgi:hypothetical protein
LLIDNKMRLLSDVARSDCFLFGGGTAERE